MDFVHKKIPGPLLVTIAGPQGSGKSTLAMAIDHLLGNYGVHDVVLVDSANIEPQVYPPLAGVHIQTVMGFNPNPLLSATELDVIEKEFQHDPDTFIEKLSNRFLRRLLVTARAGLR